MSAQARLSMVLSHLQLRTKQELRPDFPLLPQEERKLYNGEKYYNIIPSKPQISLSRTSRTGTTCTSFQLNGVSTFDELFNFVNNRISEDCPSGNIAFCDVVDILQGFECDKQDQILYLGKHSEFVESEYNVIYSNLEELDHETITGMYEFVILNQVKSSLVSDLVEFIRATNPNAIIITIDSLKNLSSFQEWNADVFVIDSDIKLSIVKDEILDRIKDESYLNMSQAYKSLNLPTSTELSLLKLELCTGELIESMKS